MAGGLTEGREQYDAAEWAAAFETLTRVHDQQGLGPADLERLGFSAYLTGRDRETEAVLGRAHQAWLDAGDPVAAARTAFWIGLGFVDRGEMARASGWFGRGQRLVADAEPCAETGLLMVPDSLAALMSGAFDEALAGFAAAGRIAEECDDADLRALALLGQGQALVFAGRPEEGLPLLDETMVGVVAGEPTPIIVGLVYCAVIETCQRAFDLRRASEWTAALSSWCSARPDLEPYRGQCLVHRAQILRVHGSWDDALTEARRARDALGREPVRPAFGGACYELGELHRLRGETGLAEAAYLEASRGGHHPQPGLARLRLAQGRTDEAWAALADLQVPDGDLARAADLLEAVGEVALARDDLGAARDAARRLRALPGSDASDHVAATAGLVEGRVHLAAGDPAAACDALRTSILVWQHLELPLAAARARHWFGLARQELGDRDTAEMELDAARRVFEALGAAPDLELLTTHRDGTRVDPLLTRRERDVLARAAAGRTNRAIAEELTISAHTVRRHLQNIYAKLGVSTRAEATARAYERGLLR